MSVTDEQGSAVLKLMAEEGATIRKACKAVGCRRSTFWDWSQRQENRERYSRARDAQLEYWADDVIDVADDNSRDVEQGPDGEVLVNYDHIARSKLRVDSRKWLLSKLRPDKYGEHTKVELSGSVDVVGLLAARKQRAIDGES